MGPLRLNLQWKVLLLVTGGMTLILVLSAYLHAVITRSLVEDDRYNTAVAQTLALAERIVAGGLLRDAEDLRRDIVLVAEGRRDFRQIDVYRNNGSGLNLAATNVSDAPRLPSLDASARDNDLGEMEHPLPDVVTMEIVRDGARHWLISVSLSGVGGPGYVDALVAKNPEHALVSRLQSQHNVVLGGAIVVCVGLLYLMFAQ